MISSAILAGNVELEGAADRGIAVWRRQQTLAALVAGRRAVAVAGTHGKTTTTSMIAAVLAAAGLDPTYVIGGDLNETGGGARHGAGDLFVYEADESDGSFLLGRRGRGSSPTSRIDHVEFYGLASLRSRLRSRYSRARATASWPASTTRPSAGPSSVPGRRR